MKKAIVPLFAMVLVALLLFSFAHAEPSNPVKNAVSMKSPFSTGSHGSGGSHQGDSSETHRADHDKKGGIIYAEATCSAALGTGSSNAWADSDLRETFEIIHSSMYKITFGFNYKGMVGATAVPGILGTRARANVKVILHVSLVNSQDGNTVFQKDEIIFEKEVTADETPPQEISGTIIIEDSMQLESNSIYEWRAGIRTETNADNQVYFEYGNDAYQNGIAEATANFFNKQIGYQVNIEEVLVEDLYPDNIAPTTTATLTGTEAENGWYTSDVTIELSVADNNPSNSYGVDYTNRRINNSSWKRYQSPFTITSEGVNIVEFYSVDKANNEETPSKEISVKIDKTPPTGEVTINNNDESTYSSTVTLITQAYTEQESETTQMHIRNEGENWSSWKAYTSAPISWTLRSGDGTKRVYVQLKDEAGNISPEFYDDITLDSKSAPSPSPSPTPSSSPKRQPSETLTPSSEECNIIVYVKDSNNNIVEGATVTSTTQPSGQSPLVGTSDSTGSTKFSNILPGSYTFRATKNRFGGNSDSTIAKSQQTISSNIVIKIDLTPPTISIDLEPASPQNSHQMVFTVTADDNIDGCGISQITLYIDKKAVAVWTTKDTHIYVESFSPQSSHSCYAEALDNADNKARYPSEENFEFSVPLEAQHAQFSPDLTDLGQISGGITILVMTAILILLGMKRKK
jgi:hypothetical protein